MSDNQDALRLADALEQQFPIGTAQHYLDGEAAAELRRLHSLNAELAGLIQQIIDSRDEHFIDNCVDGMWGWDERANAALAKVQGESNGS